MPETKDPKDPREAQLDALLHVDEDEPPRPGFDTRFFARLEEVKQEEQKADAPFWQRLAVWLAPVAVGAAAVLVMVSRPSVEPAGTAEGQIARADMPVAMELELLEDLDVLEHLDEVEAFAVLAELDLEEIEAEALR